MKTNQAYTTYTRKNCTLDEWRDRLQAEYAKVGVDPATVRPLREQHAYEGGDTTMGWAQHVAHQNKMRERSRIMKELNG